MIGHDFGILHGLSHLILLKIQELDNIMIMSCFSDEESETKTGEETKLRWVSAEAGFENRQSGPEPIAQLLWYLPSRF